MAKNELFQIDLNADRKFQNWMNEVATETQLRCNSVVHQREAVYRSPDPLESLFISSVNFKSAECHCWSILLQILSSKTDQNNIDHNRKGTSWSCCVIPRRWHRLYCHSLWLLSAPFPFKLNVWYHINHRYGFSAASVSLHTGALDGVLPLQQADEERELDRI